MVPTLLPQHLSETTALDRQTISTRMWKQQKGRKDDEKFNTTILFSAILIASQEHMTGNTVWGTTKVIRQDC